MQQGGFECIERKCDDRGSAMMLAALVGAAGKDVVLSLVIDDALILDHASFRKHDQLAVVQDFPGQEWKQVRHVIGHDTYRVEKLAEAFVALEEFR